MILGSIRRLNNDLRMMIGLFQLVPRSLEELTSGSALLEGIRERGGAFLSREVERIQTRAQQRAGGIQAGQVGAGVAAAVAPPGALGSSTTVNQGGDSITMNITGASEAEMMSLMDRLRVNRNRQAMAAAAGGER